MAKHFGYYEDWRTAQLECPRCGWKGTFDQGSVEHHDYLMDSSCPQCPGGDGPMLAIVRYPTLQESEQNWLRLTDAERQEVDSRKQFLDHWNRVCLKSTDQLPELEGTPLTLVWDQVKDESDD